MTFVANTLKSQDGRGWAHDAEATYIAAPLSHGSNPNMAGRRREDDENLVTAFYPTGGSKDGFWSQDVSRTLKVSAANGMGIADGMSVRRLTPIECERLQALPDGWTNPTGDAPDSRRYAGLGDAVTASVGEWIGRRILATDGCPECHGGAKGART